VAPYLDLSTKGAAGSYCPIGRGDDVVSAELAGAGDGLVGWGGGVCGGVNQDGRCAGAREEVLLGGCKGEDVGGMGVVDGVGG
jgi:hypothetical protein